METLPPLCNDLMIQLIMQDNPYAYVDAANCALVGNDSFSSLSKSINNQLCGQDILTESFKIDEYKRRTSLINVTKVKQEFFLTENDLQPYSYKVKQNPVYRNGPNMRLYRVKDIEQAFYKKFNTYNKSLVSEKKLVKRTAVKEKIVNNFIANTSHLFTDDAERALFLDVSERAASCYNSSRDAKTFIECARRFQELKASLRAASCDLRKDSRLCINYIDYGSYDVTYIVNTMMEMKFLFMHTNYEQIRNQLIVDAGHYAHRYYISDEAKTIALEQYTGDPSLIPPHLL